MIEDLKVRLKEDGYTEEFIIFFTSMISDFQQRVEQAGKLVGYSFKIVVE